MDSRIVDINDHSLLHQNSDYFFSTPSESFPSNDNSKIKGEENKDGKDSETKNKCSHFDEHKDAKQLQEELLNINESKSLFSESYDNYSKASCSFLESLNNTKQITNLNEKQDKDEIINSLTSRVSSLENLCTTLIAQINSLQDNQYQNIEIQKRIQNMNINNQYAINGSKGTNTIKLGNKPQTTQNSLETCSSCKQISFINKTSDYKCAHCLKFVCSFCVLNCANSSSTSTTPCKAISCKACSKCNICKLDKYCWECKSGCNQCIKNENAFCINCVKDCQLCLSKFCKKCCAFKCGDCLKVACLMCSWNCKVCLGNYCNDYENQVCKVCGVKTCIKCLADCEGCEKKVCKNCIKACDKCKNPSCKKCSYKNLKSGSYLCNNCPSLK